MAQKEGAKLALVQHACPPGRAKSDNFARAAGLIREAARQGATLVVTQELFTTAYFPQAADPERFDLAEPVPGPTTEKLGELAGELGVAIAGSVFEKRAAGLYHNTSVLLNESGELIGQYRKMHIPDDPGFYEKFYFSPGDLGFQTVSAGGTRAGMLVCWDQWFPEAARLTAMQGAELLLYPSAIGWVDGEGEADQRAQREAWRTVQRSHAIANGVYVAAVNRLGREGSTTFWGGSFVADPAGQVVAEAGEREEEVLLADLDPAAIEAWRRGWPFLRDRRVDAYGGLTRKWGE